MISCADVASSSICPAWASASRHPAGHYNISRGYSANGLNQYQAAGSASFTYDANGNLTADGSTSFLYDQENRLISVSGAKNAEVYYDPLGRLHEVRSASGTTFFVWDGSRLAMEYNGAGQLLRRYAHGNGAGDNPLTWYEGAGMDSASERFLRTDERGSVVSVSTATTVLGINRYDEYGIPQSSNLGRFQYTGQAWLPELGLYYYKARMYSPTLGRFMQTDPIGYADGLNWYDYVGGDPVNKVDPTGMWSATNMQSENDKIFDLSGSVLSIGKDEFNFTFSFERMNRDSSPGSPCLGLGGPCDPFNESMDGPNQLSFGRWLSERFRAGFDGTLLGRAIARLGECDMSKIEGRKVIQSAATGAAVGATRGAIVGAFLGSWAGPAGSAAGSRGGAISGATSSAASSAMVSAVRQSCSI